MNLPSSTEIPLTLPSATRVTKVRFAAFIPTRKFPVGAISVFTFTCVEALFDQGTVISKTSNISIVRTVNGKPTRTRFNYKEFTRGKNLAQNIELKPGDQIIVP